MGGLFKMAGRKKGCLLLALLLIMVMALSGCQNSGFEGKLDAKNPVSIEIWHYYNGPQKTEFDRLVTEFNETVGKEKGIIVEAFSQGNSISALVEKVMDAANKKVGAGEIPDVFAAYADTAYQVDQLGLVASLDAYLTKEELDEYVAPYMEEGRFDEEGSLKIFTIAKSTELFMLNKTDWDRFAAATGAKEEDLQTMEGLCRIAASYYEWTDSLTPEANDGKAFFGRDAMANYIIIGSKQLGTEIFSVKNGKVTFQVDETIMRKLWDNYYVPFINGWFGASGRFRSDDIKMGNIIACVGSSSGAAYFPDECILSDTESYPIEMRAYPCPKFEGGEDYAVQQGAGLVVTNAAPQEVEASVEFLKWFTEAGRNLEFSLGSGYVPVKKEANEMTFVEQAMDAAGASSKMRAIITNAIGRNGTAARAILNDSMVEKARADREAFLALTAEGMPHEEAAAQFVTDENFEAWYEETRTALEMCIAG